MKIPTIFTPELNISPRVAEHRRDTISWMVPVDMDWIKQEFGEAVLGMTSDTATPQFTPETTAAPAPTPSHTGEKAVGIVEHADRLEASRLAVSKAFGGL